MWQLPKPFDQVPQEKVFKVGTLAIALVILLIIFNAFTGANRSGFDSDDGAMTLGAPSISSLGYAPMPQNAGVATKMARYSGEADYGGNAVMAESIMPMPPMNPVAGSAEYPSERKVIRNGSLSLLVNDVDKAANQITSLATQYKGFVDAQNIMQYNGDQRSGSMSIRVPGESFLTVMQQIKLLAVRTTNEQVNSNDVSAQFVDLESNLRNYKVEEAQYQEIMKRSGKVSEVLEVAQALSRVRGNIERTQGQMNYLSRQVAMSSISISLMPVSDAKEVTNKWSPGLVFKDAYRALAIRATYLADNLIRFFVSDLPIFLVQIAIFALVMFGFYKAGRAIWRKAHAASLPPMNK